MKSLTPLLSTARKIGIVVILYAFLIGAYVNLENSKFSSWGPLQHEPTYPTAEGLNTTKVRHDYEDAFDEIRTTTFQTRDTPKQVLAFYIKWASRCGFRVWQDEVAPGTTSFVSGEVYGLDLSVTTELLANGLTHVEIKTTLFRGM